ncbi:hypothetical protein [Halomonas sp. AOP42-D1-22]|uniref:hypothetical protein n=1 Tax=Halomonas sp. AOP42-D1-22 TaxID=3457667 RepID=UPI0040332ACE
MESLYYYFLFESNLHSGLASLLSVAVPAIGIGIATGCCIGAMLLFGGSGFTLSKTAFRVVTLIERRSALVLTKCASTLLAKTQGSSKAESVPQANPDDPWLIYDDAPYLRGVMVTKDKELSHD